MKLHSGIITDKLFESKEFYTQILDFEIKFESDWFILLNVKERPEYELALMLPEQAQTRKDYFQKNILLEFGYFWKWRIFKNTLFG